MSNRTAIVTGAAGGLGQAICNRLLADEWTVLAGDLAEAVGGAAIEGVQPVELDVRSQEDFVRAIGLANELGELRLVVNNAGIVRRGRLEEMADDDWEAVMDVNLHGVFRGVRAGGASMLEHGGGTIVNISSVAAERGPAGRAAYAVAKAGVVAMTRTAAAEWAGRGVRVNAVAPGYVLTDLNRAAVECGQLDEQLILSRIPAGRWGKATEIADAVAFLASDQASYITGQVLTVDGGFLVDYGVPLSD